jgi:hypothetical protein
MTTDDNQEALVLIGQMLRKIHDLSDVLTAVTAASRQVNDQLAEIEAAVLALGAHVGREP